MSKRRGDFDDDEGFFESLMKRKDSVPMPASMAKLFKMVIGAAVLIVVGLITWAVWPNGDNSVGDAVPIIRAESGDYKVEPDDKGGMIIPNKDSTIFETMDNAAAPDKKVESLLEDSEQPMKKEEAFIDGTAEATDEKLPEKFKVVAGENKENITITTDMDDPKDSSEKTETETVLNEIAKEAPKEVVKAEVVKPVKEVTEPARKKVDIIDALKQEAGTKEPAKVKPAPKGSVYIQLASVKSDADAKTKWASLKSKYASLASLSLKVQKADLGAKGTFYRVQAGPTSADNAASICAKIKAAKGDCLIAK